MDEQTTWQFIDTQRRAIKACQDAYEEKEWMSAGGVGIERLARACDRIESLAVALALHRWIPVEERLPEMMSESNYRSKVIWVTDGQCIWQTAYNVSQKQFIEKRFNCSTPITHWKSIVLPE